MEYKKLDDAPYYKECEPLIEGLGCVLVSLRIVGHGADVRVECVIAKKGGALLGVDDLEEVHKALLPRLEALLGSDDVAMELSSPGIERNIKNAAEFALFVGHKVKVWSAEKGDWIVGQIVSSDDKSVVIKAGEGDVCAVEYDKIAKARLAVTAAKGGNADV